MIAASLSCTGISYMHTYVNGAEQAWCIVGPVHVRGRTCTVFELATGA